MTVRTPVLTKTSFNEWTDPEGQVSLRIEVANDQLPLGQPFNSGPNKVLSQRTAILVINACTENGIDVLIARMIVKFQVPNAELSNGPLKIVSKPPITGTVGNGNNQQVTIKWSDNDIKDTFNYMLTTLFNDDVWSQP